MGPLSTVWTFGACVVRTIHDAHDSVACPGPRLDRALVQVLLLGARFVGLPQPVFRMRFLPAVGYALDVLLHVLSPAVGNALFTRCGSALLTRCGSALLSSVTVFWTSSVFACS